MYNNREFFSAKIRKHRIFSVIIFEPGSQGKKLTNRVQAVFKRLKIKLLIFRNVKKS
jgi:hypothetical protein